MKNIFISILLLFLFGTIHSQETIEVFSLTSKTIVIHYDEGYITHPVNGEYDDEPIVFKVPLSVDESQQVMNYSISSSDDENYMTASNPISVYRKSKPTEFGRLCQTWDYIPFYEVFGCVNLQDDHIMEHYIYLELNSAFTNGKNYTIDIVNSSFDGNMRSFLFSYNESQILSPAIHVNNIAYSTSAENKYAYVYAWLGDGGSLDLSAYSGNDFQLINDQTGASVYSNELEYRASENTIESYRNESSETPNNNFLGAEVYACDFSSYNFPGIYHLEIDGIGRSNSFEIACNAYRKPFEYSMKGLFINRSGIAIDKPYAEQARPAPHNPQLTPGFMGKLKYSMTKLCEVSDADASQADSILWENGILGDLTDSWGWYQDAGDWDAYISHYNVPVKLMLTYQLNPSNFVDNQLIIPESDNGIPDILDEARWLIRFYKRLKDETEMRGYTSGGVAGERIFGDLWGDDLGEEGIIRGSWQDNDRQWVVSGEDIPMTFAYAGMAAHLAVIYKDFGFSDPENIDWELEAKDAFTWANTYYDPTYDCHNTSVSSLKNYASSALFMLTDNTSFEEEFISSFYEMDYPVIGQFADEQAYGSYIFALNDVTQQTLKDSIIQLIEESADYNFFEIGNDRSARWASNPYFPMLAGHGTTPYIFDGVMAYHFLKTSNPSKAENYLRMIHNTCDYFMGNNPLGYTWITGLGEKSPTGILHLDSWATEDGSVKAGIVPYGPWKNAEQIFNVGPFHHHWPHQWVYPGIDNWPGHERWFDQRYAALGPEYTIHQNNINAAAVYGSISGVYDCSEIVLDQKNISLVDEDSIGIYPNPTNNQFRVIGMLDQFSLKVIDQTGQTVMSFPPMGTDYSFSIEILEAGLYFIQIESNNDKIFLKQVIKM